MAVKVKTMYFCNNCGAESPKWVGKCPACGEWNTYVEEKVAAKPTKTMTSFGGDEDGKKRVMPIKISDIKTENQPRIQLPSNELNRVLGGGLVPGSIILVGGEPGIGKSTLILQNVLRIQFAQLSKILVALTSWSIMQALPKTNSFKTSPMKTGAE